MKTPIIGWRSFLLLGVLLWQCGFYLSAAPLPNMQQVEVTGTVTDSENVPLPGVNIIVVGTTRGVVTDFDGKYSIAASPGDVLQFTYIGMQSQQLTVGESTTINVTLQGDSNTLDEVVVVGYGTQSRAKVTGAVSTVKAEDISSIPSVNAVQALQGRASGLTVINNGSPGTSPTVRIRGIGTLENNNPVYVVDGIIVDDIANLSAGNIESVSVLKDASTTSVYGSLGANGVVVIKTKTGRKGATTFDFNTYYGVQFKPKELDVLNTDQYIDYASDMILNADPGATLPAVFTDPDFTSNNVNYQDAIFQSGSINNYELSASGGGEHARFRVSGEYQTQDGIVLNTDFDKYTFRLNSEFNKGIFTLGESLGLTYSEQDPLILAFSVSPMENAIRMAPYLPIRDANNIGGYSELTADDINTARNPVRTLNRETQVNKRIDLIGNIYGLVDIFEGLQYKANVGLNFFDNKFKKTELPYGSQGGLHNQAITRFSYVDLRSKTVTFNNSLRYTTTLAENHHIEVLALAEQRKTEITSLSGVGTTDLGINDLASGLSGGAGTTEENRIGYLGRLNYDFAEKYILAASVRRDASSRFGSNKRWGTFPALAAGWVVSEEDFFGEDTVIDYLKLRASWGLAGNDKSAGNYNFESSLLANFFYGNTPGLATNRVSNPDLGWEETEITNIGVDMYLLDNAITFSAEYYNNTSNDLIVALPPAASVGVPNATPTNIGGMTTKGFEFNLGYANQGTEFNWSANLNLSTTDNEVTQLAPNVEQLFNGNKPNVLGNNTISRIAENESLWHFYGWQTDGIFQNQGEVDAHATQAGAAPGDIRFRDVNGDGVINDDDRTVIGNPFPKVTYGLSLDADYKNFDVSLLFTGVSGNDIFNASRYYLDGAAQLSNAGTAVLNRWTPTNPSTTQPRAVLNDPNNNARVSDRYVEDGSYFRLKNISLGYNLPPSVLNVIAADTISKCRVYMSAQNLFTITDYSGYDPEIGPSLGIASVTGDQNSELGVDRGQYPQSKSLVVGLQITF
ncbi:MAG: SusC/RagA family TonB-linked outer membrane protein [Flavobacteriaceae bacterium]